MICPGQVAEKGKYMMGKILELKEKHPILIDVRGKGFLIGLDYPTPEMGWAVSKGLFSRGVLTGGTLNNARTNRIEPPGIMSYETMDKMLAILDETLSEVEAEFGVTKDNVVSLTA
jgi:putrescine aminotransferase